MVVLLSIVFKLSIQCVNNLTHGIYSHCSLDGTLKLFLFVCFDWMNLPGHDVMMTT